METIERKRVETGDIEHEVGSGNVFADLGLPDADELLAKSELVLTIQRTMKARKLSQQKASELMGVDQPTLSKLLRGKLKSFTIGRLLGMLMKLDQDVEITIRPRLNKEKGAGQIRVVNRTP